MKVVRIRYSDGIQADQISGLYEKAQIRQRDNNNWPGHGFDLRIGEWKASESKPEVGYQSLQMWGAEIFLLDGGGYILYGFVNDETDWITGHQHKKEGTWNLEKWICQK